MDIAVIEERVNTMSAPKNRAELLDILHRANVEQLALADDMFHVMPPAMLRMALGDVAIDPEAQAIADHVRQLIRDGDTIQVGVGQPSSFMFKAGAFDDAHHLGLHTELGSPGLAKLWERGIFDNSQDYPQATRRSPSPGPAATAKTSTSSATTRRSNSTTRTTC